MSDFNSLVQYTVENISRPIKYIIYKLTEFIRVVDKFVFRQVPAGAASGYANIEKVEGNTVAWDQLVQNGNFSDGTNTWGVSNMNCSVVNGVLEASSKAGSTNSILKNLPLYPNGHKVYYSFRYQSNKAVNIQRHQSVLPSILDANDTMTRLSGISTVNGSTTQIYFYNYTTFAEDEWQFKLTDYIEFDLTAIFGAGNEPTTVADFEAWLAQNIGTLPYYDYNAGELLSVKMSGMQTNTSRLPLGYQELEYLKSSGTQYIDTNINITSNFKVVLDIKIPSAIDSTKVILQGKNSISSFKIAGYSNTTLSSTIDNNPSSGGISYTPAQRGIIGLSTHAKKGMSDDVWIELERPFSGTDTLLLFGTAIINLYNAKLYNGNVLLANFIPAKRLSDNVLGMYDTVSNTFFTNAGTGTFIGGPEVHLDTLPFDVTTITGINTATNVREVIFPNGMKQADREGTVKDTLDLRSDTATVNVGSRAYQSGDESDPDVLTDGTTTYFPSIEGYKLLDSVTIPTNSYLITNIQPRGDIHIEMDFETTTFATGGQLYMGGRDGFAGSGIGFGHDGYKYWLCDGLTGTRYISSYTMLSNTRYVFRWLNGVATLLTGGISVATNTFSPTITPTTPLSINGYNINGGVSAGETIKVYAFRAWNSQGEMIANYVPVVNITTSQVGLYDFVSGAFLQPTAGTWTAGTVLLPITYTDLQDANGNPLNPRYKVEQGGTEQVLPTNTSTPTTVAPTLTTVYTKDNN